MGIENARYFTSPFLYETNPQLLSGTKDKVKDLLLKSIRQKDFNELFKRLMSNRVDKITIDLALKLIFHSPNAEESYKKGMSKERYGHTYVVISPSTK